VNLAHDMAVVLGLCVRPGAPTIPCCICGKPVHTCEKEYAEGGDYRCPAHPEGSQLSDGRWVCSEECWETATK
jgi:hypothetical protein